MAKFPALPLWTDAYLADTTHLTDAEHGLYLQLLIHAWRSPECRLPNNDEWIARKLRKSVEDVRREVRPIIKEFFESTGNWLVQKRLKKEWNYKKTQSGNAKSRWDKENNESQSDAKAIQNGCQNDAVTHVSHKPPTLPLSKSPSEKGSNTSSAHTREATPPNPEPYPDTVLANIEDIPPFLDRRPPPGNADGEQEPELEPDAGKATAARRLIEKTAKRMRAPTGPTDYDKPENRKRRWEQKVEDYLRATRKGAASSIIVAYHSGSPEEKDAAKRIYEKADKEMKARARGARVEAENVGAGT